MHRPTPLLRLLLAVLLPLLILSACGDDDGGLGDLAGDGGSSDGSGGGDDRAGGGDVSIPDGIDIPEGLQMADSLIPELAHLPMPDEVAFVQGSALSAEQDPRETAVQEVHLTMSPEDVVRFYLEELPAAGFTIDSGGEEPTEPMAQYAIEFTDPEGLPGNLVINSGAFSAAQMNINLFRSGTR